MSDSPGLIQDKEFSQDPVIDKVTNTVSICQEYKQELFIYASSLLEELWKCAG